MALYSFKDGKTYKDGVEVSLATPKPTHGLGDVVGVVASGMGVQASPGCGCAKRKQVLNRWTPAWLSRLISRILTG